MKKLLSYYSKNYLYLVTLPCFLTKSYSCLIDLKWINTQTFDSIRILKLKHYD